MKKFGNVLIAAILGSVFTLSINFFLEKKHSGSFQYVAPKTPVSFAGNTGKQLAAGTIDFTAAAEKTVHAVVHIKSASVVNHLVYGYQKYYDPMQELLGISRGSYSRVPQNKQELKITSGSGVIISPDGYIVTNNHVIEDADELEVVTNDNKSFKAKVIGTDPSTDLAVLKIEAKALPFLNFANSDNIKIGNWVLAVGNPFNLSSTVTAGIISAKARNINILKEKTAIESFIQTDAAVNPGNSGGALVNLNGDLIGINSAIASPNGAFTGYSFAIPSNIVSKVTEDLIKFGIVQRAFLGVQLAELDAQSSKDLDVNLSQGVYIVNVMSTGAAADAHLQKNDIILEINGNAIKKESQLLEKLSSFRPGDQISLEIFRKGKKINKSVVLKNREGTTSLVKNDAEYIFKKLGLKVNELSKEEKAKYSINGGVSVEEITTGKIKSNTKMQKGFVILKANGKAVKTKKKLLDIIRNADGSILLAGFYPGYYGQYYYAINF